MKVLGLNHIGLIIILISKSKMLNFNNIFKRNILVVIKLKYFKRIS